MKSWKIFLTSKFLRLSFREKRGKRETESDQRELEKEGREKIGKVRT
jgi:hypothetical protein